MAARPTIKPATPVWRRRLKASSALMMSPLPITGIRTAAATSPITDQSAYPEYPCAFVRP